MERHEWLDRGKFPFQSRFTEVGDTELHYLDEGTGRPLLCLHGNPTWSFLYRSIIEDLRDHRRCVAVDWPGFGLSAKPPDADYGPRWFATILSRFLDRLELESFDLLVHDWGGPIGLDLASRQPDRLGKLVVFNSWFESLDSYVRVRWFSRIMRSPLGYGLAERWNLFPRLMWGAVQHRTRFRAQALPYYLVPFGAGSRRAPRSLAASLTGASQWLDQLDSRVRANLTDVPLLLLWGTKDPVLSTSLIDRWEDTFSDHETRRIHDAGHFVPEDIRDEYNDEIKTFLG